jgi:hypothetical protein
LLFPVINMPCAVDVRCAATSESATMCHSGFTAAGHLKDFKKGGKAGVWVRQPHSHSCCALPLPFYIASGDYGGIVEVRVHAQPLPSLPGRGWAGAPKQPLDSAAQPMLWSASSFSKRQWVPVDVACVRADQRQPALLALLCSVPYVHAR